MTAFVRRYRWIILAYALSTVVTVGGGYVFGMSPSFDRQCWGWTNE